MLPDYRVRQRDYLLEISRALTEELNLDKLLKRVLNISIEMLAGQAGFIALHEKSRGWVIAVEQSLPEALYRYLEDWIARLSTEKDPDQIQIHEINRFLKDISMGMINGVGLQLIAQDEVIGLIYIFRNYPGIFSPNDRILLSSFANQAAIVVRNARLYTQTITEKRRMDALLDSAADGILIVTQNHIIERANPAFARLFGIDKKDIEGRAHDEIISWAKTTHGAPLEMAEADGWPLEPNAQLYVEGDLIRPFGKPTVPVGITYAPLLTHEGALINIIATIRDITRFRQADELKSTFISEISHELKTPVALIKGYASTLRREDAHWDRNVIVESLAVIEEEADRLTELIENLLDASRLQAGGFEMKKSEVSLFQVAKSAVGRFSKYLESHTFIISIPENLPLVMCDEIRIEQVFTNLISNAIKYSPSGEIRLHGSARPNEIVICVSDQGPGIDPNDIPFIFERFYRSPDASKNTKGTGLGLYLSRAIIESHSGRMWVDTNNEVGAKICFSIPRR